jgi:hypothetical protein
MMAPSVVERLNAVLVWVVVVTGLLWLTSVALLRARRASTPAQLGGVTSSGMLLEATSQRCRLYHYTSNRCSYCAQEHNTWRTVAQAVARCGCQVVVVAPRPNEHFRIEATTSGVVEVSYTTLDVVRAGGLSRTPTTWLLDEKGRPLWSRTGVMRPRDAEALLAIAADGRTCSSARPH